MPEFKLFPPQSPQVGELPNAYVSPTPAHSPENLENLPSRFGCPHIESPSPFRIRRLFVGTWLASLRQSTNESSAGIDFRTYLSPPREDSRESKLVQGARSGQRWDGLDKMADRLGCLLEIGLLVTSIKYDIGKDRNITSGGIFPRAESGEQATPSEMGWDGWLTG